MKGSGLFLLLSTLVLLVAHPSTAWPWSNAADDQGDVLLWERQEERPADTQQAAASSTVADNGDDTPTASKTVTGTVTATATTGSAKTGTVKSGSTNSTKTAHTKSTSIDPRLPPGGISLITPAPVDGIQYYKVGDFVTFKWNYTSLSVTPSAIDVLASCIVNSATYTIAANMSVEETGAVTWDTGEFQATATNPFPVASYYLIVHDAAKDVTDVPSAGYLGAYQQYVFGMYTGQPYVPLNEFKCATCNGALSLHERQALGVIMTTVAITVVSFTWFSYGFGVF